MSMFLIQILYNTKTLLLTAIVNFDLHLNKDELESATMGKFYKSSIVPVKNRYVSEYLCALPSS